MRLFIALDLPADAVRALERAQAGLPGRLADPETFHVTLAFLGEIREPAAEEVADALDLLAPAPFLVALRGLEMVAGGTAVAAGVAPAPGLEALQASVVRAVRRAGLVLERRRFRPHVTLARLPRAPAGAEAEGLARALGRGGHLRIGPFPAESFSLYRSILNPSGARHTPLATFPIA